MFRRIKNILQALLVFYVSFVLMISLTGGFYEVDSNGYLDIPGYYQVLMVVISIAVAGSSFYLPKILKKKILRILNQRYYDDSATRLERWIVDNHDKQLDKSVERTLNGSYFIPKSVNIDDPLLEQAELLVIEANQASVSFLQSKMKLNYTDAARVIDILEKRGIIGSFDPTHPRKVFEKHKDFQAEIVENEQNVCKHRDVDEELKSIDVMDGHSFEYYCATLMRKHGFINVTVTPGSGDHGADIIAEKDGVRYAVQCKCYSHDLGNTPVQEIFAAKEMYDCHVPVVMTNRYFTKGAKELAKKTKVLLWDRDMLKSMVE